MTIHSTPPTAEALNSYIRLDDGAFMVEVAPHQFTSLRAARRLRLLPTEILRRLKPDLDDDAAREIRLHLLTD